MKLVAGNSNRPLAEAISAHLDLPLARCIVRRFADMEIFVEVQENVRGEDVPCVTGQEGLEALRAARQIIDQIGRGR